MSVFFKSSHIYSQYNPFEITKIILSEKCDIVKSITNILKNMKVNNNNQLYHEMGVIYLNRLLKYCPTKYKDKKNIFYFDESYSMEEENEENMESNMDEENEEEDDDDNNMSDNNNSNENRENMEEEFSENIHENDFYIEGNNNDERQEENDEIQ
jgi:hypothetical protein